MYLLNRTILAMIIILVSFLTYAQERGSKINVETNVDSAGLFVDNTFIGAGNKFSLEKDPGIYSIILVEDLIKWDAEIITDTITLLKDEEKNISYNFRNKSVLDSNPDDARVYENDSLIGFTPLLIEAGIRGLKLEKPEYIGLYMTPTEISSGQIAELKFNGAPPKKEFYGTLLFGVLTGTAIALGAATAYYKLKADDLYEEYKLTADPGLVDNIDHYDGQSAGTFIAMELCVGALIYFFLTY